MTTEARLEALWGLLRGGVASEQDRVDAAALAGRLRRRSDLPRLIALLDDPSEQVRWFALQSLIIDLDHRTSSTLERCWLLLEADPSDDVRSMAAACIGKFLLNQKSIVDFDRLVAKLKKSETPEQLKGAIYRALFRAAEWPPEEWPGLFSQAKPFRTEDIDWEMVAALQDGYHELSAAP